MKKIDELYQICNKFKKEAQALLDDNKTDEARAKLDEAKKMKAKIELQEELDKETEEALKQEINDPEKPKSGISENRVKQNANAIRAIIKKMTNRALTDAENALLLPTESKKEGENGEGYILPQDISTQIHKKIREYRSMRDVVGYMPTSALTGSFPIENFETVSELIDFADGTDGAESNDIKFTNVNFALKEKAAFIKLSNTLLNMTDNALIAYIVEVFAKKAVITENKMTIATLKSNKTVKELTSWNTLSSSLNTDLDPAALTGAVIVTNQDGFDFLDQQLDTTNRPILQDDPTEPTKKRFKGYPIEVFSNSMLPTTDGKAPIFYGNLKEAIKIVDLSGQINFATSSHAGFMSNTTVARLIEFIDVVQCDKSDKCYVYGKFPITETPVVNGK